MLSSAIIYTKFRIFNIACLFFKKVLSFSFTIVNIASKPDFFNVFVVEKEALIVSQSTRIQAPSIVKITDIAIVIIKTARNDIR